jgi:hypothetical protein
LTPARPLPFDDVDVDGRVAALFCLAFWTLVAVLGMQALFG